MLRRSSVVLRCAGLVLVVPMLFTLCGCSGSSGGSFTFGGAGTWYLEAYSVGGADWVTHSVIAAEWPQDQLLFYTKLFIGQEPTAFGEFGMRNQQPGSETVTNGSWSDNGATQSVSVDRVWTMTLDGQGRLVLESGAGQNLLKFRFIRAVLYWPEGYPSWGWNMSG